MTMQVPPARPVPAAQPVVMEKSARTTFEVHTQAENDPTLHIAIAAFLTKTEAEDYVAEEPKRAEEAEKTTGQKITRTLRVFQKIVETTYVLLS